MKKTLFLFLLLLFTLSGRAQLPQITLKNIGGKEVNVSQLTTEGRPVIISFFATWCKPCLRELSAIHEVYEDWQAETGVKLVAVSIDEGATSLKVKPLAQSLDWQYEVLLDPNSDLKRALQVQLVPTVIVVDGKGHIVYRHSGYSEGSEEEIIAQVRKTMKR